MIAASPGWVGAAGYTITHNYSAQQLYIPAIISATFSLPHFMMILDIITVFFLL